jgi:hypothetical protein
VVSFTPRLIYPRERSPGTHWIRGWVSPRASGGEEEIPRHCRESNPGSSFENGGSMNLWNVGILPLHYPVSQPRRPRLDSEPGRPACSRSLYWLSYPGSFAKFNGRCIKHPSFSTGVKHGLPFFGKEHGWWVLENGVLRRIFGPKRKHVAGESTLRNGLQNSYFSPC